MTDERWQLAYAIYEAAATLAEPERKEYVDAAADNEIAAKVLAMLVEMESMADSHALPESAHSTDLADAPPFRILPNDTRLAVLSSPVLSVRGEWAESILPTTPN